MEKRGGHTIGAGSRIRGKPVQLCLNGYFNRQFCKRSAQCNFVAQVGFPVGVLLVFLVFLLQAFIELAFAAAVHFGLIPVFAEIFCDIIPVSVKIKHNNSPAEALADKGQQ